jgi:hypothetical protein
MRLAPPLRRGLAALVVTACALGSATPALARNVPATLPQVLASAHFVVHYTSDAADLNAISGLGAQMLSTNAERAYATEVGQWGFPAPIDDGDGKSDIYVYKLANMQNAGQAPIDGSARSTSGWIEIQPSYATDLHVVAHEFFHLIQFRYNIFAATYLTEATAEWAGKRVSGSVAGVVPLQFPQDSLDCDNGCAAGFDPRGYSRWTFFEFLSERYGVGVVREIWERAAVSSETRPGINPIAATLEAHGTTVSAAVLDYSVTNLNGAYSLTQLANANVTAQQTLYTGSATGGLPTQTLTVSHLAAKYIELFPGQLLGSSVGCGAAVLHLRVTIPAGLDTRAYFFAKGNTAVPLALAPVGGAATLDVPWSTCPSTNRALLDLPNPSRTIDGATFTVAVSLTTGTTSTQPAAMAFKFDSSAVSLSEGAVAQGVVYVGVTTSAAGALRFTCAALGYSQTIGVAQGKSMLTLNIKPNTAPGDYAVTAASVDSNGTVGATQQLTVRIPPHAPTISASPAGPFSVIQGASTDLSFAVSASGPGTLIVSVPLLGSSQVFTLKSGSNPISVMLFRTAPAGTYALVLTPTSQSMPDGTPQRLTVVVAPKPNAPSLTLGTSKLSVEYGTAMTVSMPFTSSGAGYAWANIGQLYSQSKTLVAGANTFSLNLPPSIQPGTYTIVITPYLSSTTAGTPVRVTLVVTPRPAPRLSVALTSVKVVVGTTMTVVVPISSSAAGTLKATIDKVATQSKTLVAGSNTLALTLPASTKIGTYTLVLTPSSADGVTGTPVQLTVVVAARR